MTDIKKSLSEKINSHLTLKERILLTLGLSSPAVLAQISIIAMQYIDAAMVGSLGAEATAAVGLMAAPIWLFTGICISSISGFSVQTAQLLGAGDNIQARSVVRQGFTVLLSFTALISVIACSLSSYLPVMLGGETHITKDAGEYFFIFMAGFPLSVMNFISSAMLRSSGNMLLPSLLNIVMCLLDIVFNFFLIFPTREFTIPLLGISTEIYGAGLGIRGAALGTVSATLCTGLALSAYLCFKSPSLAVFKEKGSFRPTKHTVYKALKISLPVTAQQFMISSAQMVSTMIVAPLGTAAVAAHSLAITVEALCYMPGIGIADAATTLTGQSVGAKRRDMAVSFASITLLTGAVIMGLTGALMYFGSPYVIALMTPDHEVREAAVAVLRIEAFAEPLFAVAIVGYGICVGAGDSLIPSLINLGSMWGIRLGSAWLLSLYYGLNGVWIAMAVELNIRGLLFLYRIRKGSWLKKAGLVA